MKRNAIIRIVLWCIVLIVLLGILTTFLLGNTAYRLFRSSVSTSPLETHIAVAITTPEPHRPVPARYTHRFLCSRHCNGAHRSRALRNCGSHSAGLYASLRHRLLLLRSHERCFRD